MNKLALKQFTPVYEQAPYLLTCSSTSDDACSGLNPYVGPYYRATTTDQGNLIRMPIIQPSAGTLSSSTSTASPDQDSTNDYPEIGGSTYWNSANEGRLIIMVAPAKESLHNNSSRYPTIGRSEMSNV
jgi:hypothetical protein